MSKKIDELFSSERLRKNWLQAKTHGEKPTGAETEGQGPIEIYESLRAFIDQRFSGDDLVALHLLLDDLQALLVRLFPPEDQPPEPAEDRIKLIPAADEALCRIEDLADAYEIAGRSRPAP